MTEPEMVESLRSQPEVKICTVDGQYVRLRRCPAADVQALIEAFQECSDGKGGVAAFDLDNGRSQVHINWDTVCRIDINWELTHWKQLVGWVLVKLDPWL